MVFIVLSGTGVLRLFFKGSASDQSLAQTKHLKNMAVSHQSNFADSRLLSGSVSAYQLKQVRNLAELLPQFLLRIFEVRGQINSLAATSLDQQEQLREMERVNEIN